jgi:hypothetical protein
MIVLTEEIYIKTYLSFGEYTRTCRYIYRPIDSLRLRYEQ